MNSVSDFHELVSDLIQDLFDILGHQIIALTPSTGVDVLLFLL